MDFTSCLEVFSDNVLEENVRCLFMSPAKLAQTTQDIGHFVFVTFLEEGAQFVLYLDLI